MTQYVTRSTGPAMLVVHAGDPAGIIVNRDTVNTVLIGNYVAFDPLNESSTLDVLTYIAYDGQSDVFARSAAGNPIVDVMPGINNWAPGPVQIAASLIAAGLMKDTTGAAINTTVTGVSKDVTVSLVNTTLGAPAQDSIRTAIPANIATSGVPLLNLKTTQQTANGLVITAGTTTALTAVTGINQTAYNLHITATAGAASTKPWYTVTLKWVDTASGFTVQVDAYTAFMSGTSNVLSTVISGPTDADQLQVSVTNNDTVSMTVNTAFIIVSSRLYNTDYIYQFWTTAAMPSVPTFQIGAAVQVPTQKILFSISRTVGIGVLTTPDYALPVYAGQVAIGFSGVSSNQWTVNITNQLTGTQIYRIVIAASNLSYGLFIFPRAPLTINFTNNGSVLGTINCEIEAI